MTLVEAPGATHRDPVTITAVQGQVGGVDGATQQRGVDDVGKEVLLLEQVSGVTGLALALLVEIDVHPAGEEVLGVPLALAVAEQDELYSHVSTIVRVGDVASVGWLDGVQHLLQSRSDIGLVAVQEELTVRRFLQQVDHSAEHPDLVVRGGHQRPDAQPGVERSFGVVHGVEHGLVSVAAQEEAGSDDMVRVDVGDRDLYVPEIQPSGISGLPGLGRGQE